MNEQHPVIALLLKDIVCEEDLESMRRWIERGSSTFESLDASKQWKLLTQEDDTDESNALLDDLIEGTCDATGHVIGEKLHESEGPDDLNLVIHAYGDGLFFETNDGMGPFMSWILPA